MGVQQNIHVKLVMPLIAGLNP